MSEYNDTKLAWTDWDLADAIATARAGGIADARRLLEKHFVICATHDHDDTTDGRCAFREYTSYCSCEYITELLDKMIGESQLNQKHD